MSHREYDQPKQKRLSDTPPEDRVKRVDWVSPLHTKDPKVSDVGVVDQCGDERTERHGEEFLRRFE